MGLTFAAGVGVVVSMVGAVAWLGHKVSVIEVMRTVGKFSVVGFLLGVVFSGVLVLASRVRKLDKLSLPLVGSIGAGAGFMYWVFLASTGGRSWTPRLALLNFGVLIVMGAGSAVATLLIARKAGSSLKSGDARVHSSRDD